MIETILIVVAFLAGAWAEREHGVMWRAVILWRRVRAWATKVAKTPPSE